MSENDNLSKFDVEMIHKRSEVLIRMCEEGMITNTAFLDAFEAQKRPDVIQEESQACNNPTSTLDDSPYGRLLSHYIRRGGRFKEIDL